MIQFKTTVRQDASGEWSVSIQDRYGFEVTVVRGSSLAFVLDLTAMWVSASTMPLKAWSERPDGTVEQTERRGNNDLD